MKESAALPVLDELTRSRSFAAIARWISMCPRVLFVSHGHEIRAFCAAQQFRAAVDYCDLQMAQLSRVRPTNDELVETGRMLDRSLADLPGLGAAWRAERQGARDAH